MIAARARRLLELDLAGAPEDCGRFFATLFSDRRVYRTAAELAYDIAVGENTLNSRFHRAGLPTPKLYVVGALLMRVAEARIGMSLPETVELFGLSSPQSLNRTIRHYTGLTAATFCRSFTPDDRLLKFRLELVLPFRDVLQGFRPLIANQRWGKAA